MMRILILIIMLLPCSLGMYAPMPVSRHLCPVNQGFFCPYCVTAARRFLMRSAACLRVIRFRQSGQYLTQFDFDTKNEPHSVQRFLSSVLKSSAYSNDVKDNVITILVPSDDKTRP